MGDSYTAGPLIPSQSTDPLGCLRSDRNYPHLTAPDVAAAKFVDVSCSGAQTKHFAQSQDVTPGPNAPQYDALGATTKIVTIGIGGNDIGFSGIVQNCATENPFGDGCKPEYVHDGRDELREKIAATAPKIDAVIDEVQHRAPSAHVFIVGYPTILPETGGGCYPVVPILPDDVRYLRGIAKDLNQMLADRAAAGGVHYVDVATSSIGHDMCSSSRWVESIVPTNLAAPVHPNAAGMRNTARDVTAAIDAVVTS
ncbi:MAG: SGNH/GDSL hydrolase family protein [Acidimicrobiales bacterium]|nr:SGNH/GDSL hydrolase family protein [Acidimicrobiales bacterium]